MNTKPSNLISNLEEEDIAIGRYEPGKRIEGRFVRAIRPILKWFGFLSTFAWGVAALSPDTFQVPQPLQGWVFLIFIVWVFAFCAGLFNL